MLGVCCTCQEAHPVSESVGSIDDFWDFEDGEISPASYLMAEHDPSFGGGRCEGSGMTPQAIINNKDKDQDED